MKISVWILILLSCFAFALSGYKLYFALSHPLKFKEEIVFCANDYKLQPEFIASVINVESSFRKNSRSNKNAIGLMQIKLSTANYLNKINNLDEITETELFDPKTNIKYGCTYLQYLIKKFTSVNTAIAAYNAGETRVRTWLKSKEYSCDGINLNHIPYEETRNYVKKINKNIQYYEKLF